MGIVEFSKSLTTNLGVATDADGALDGEIELGSMGKAKKKMEELKPKVQALLAQLRPWSELGAISKPQTGDDVSARIFKNVHYFQANYIVVGAGLMIAYVLTSASALMIIGLLSIFWAWFLQKNEDENWQPVVMNIPLQAKQRLVIATFASVLLLLAFVGGLLLSALGLHGLVCTAHASFATKGLEAVPTTDADDLDVI